MSYYNFEYPLAYEHSVFDVASHFKDAVLETRKVHGDFAMKDIDSFRIDFKEGRCFLSYRFDEPELPMPSLMLPAFMRRKKSVIIASTNGICMISEVSQALPAGVNHG